MNIWSRQCLSENPGRHLLSRNNAVGSLNTTLFLMFCLKFLHNLSTPDLFGEEMGFSGVALATMMV